MHLNINFGFSDNEILGKCFSGTMFISLNHPMVQLWHQEGRCRTFGPSFQQRVPVTQAAFSERLTALLLSP